MVQILENVKQPHKGERLARALSAGMGATIGHFQGEQKKKEEAAKLAGERGHETAIQKLKGEQELAKVQAEREKAESVEALKGQAKSIAEKEKIEHQRQQDEETNKGMKTFAEKLRNNYPGSALHKSIADIYDLDINPKQKTDLVESLIGIDPWKQDQQRRLKIDQYLKRYGQKIKELDNDIKVSSGAAKQDLLKEKRRLQVERDEILDQMAMEGESYDEEEEPKPKKKKKKVEAEEEPEEAPKPAKPRFDKNKQEHKAKAQEIYNTLDPSLPREERQKIVLQKLADEFEI